MQLQLLPDAIDDQANRLHVQHQVKAWQELKVSCQIIGQYRHFFGQENTGRCSLEIRDVLAVMAENMQRVNLARRIFDNGNYSDTLKVLNKVIW